MNIKQVDSLALKKKMENNLFFKFSMDLFNFIDNKLLQYFETLINFTLLYEFIYENETFNEINQNLIEKFFSNNSNLKIFDSIKIDRSKLTNVNTLKIPKTDF